MGAGEAAIGAPPSRAGPRLTRCLKYCRPNVRQVRIRGNSDNAESIVAIAPRAVTATSSMQISVLVWEESRTRRSTAARHTFLKCFSTFTIAFTQSLASCSPYFSLR
jgi:hypothetical protein